MSLPNTHYGAERIEKMLGGCKTLLFIGVGGVSMCSLAELARLDGYAVIGSDRCESPRLERLRQKGVSVYVGHNAVHAESADAAVYTVAIDGENEEYLAMRTAGKPLISRADYLGYVMTRYRQRIGIAGMNGKSTTTAMCGHILRGTGDPTVFCGAEAKSLDGAACLIGRAREQLVFEACEYKDSFLDFRPNIAVVLNVGMDHVDYFHSIEQIRASFLAYADLVDKDGTVLVNADDPDAMRAVRCTVGKTVTFGVKEDADYRATELRCECGRWSFSLCLHGEKLCDIQLIQPGEFQICNALAAAAAAHLCGASPHVIAERIATFVGVHRRMEFMGKLNGADVYDDYAHHPTAIEATLEGVRDMGYNRVLCAYQPHTYSRTAGLFEEFTTAFSKADRVYFADIYAAREENLSGVSSEQLAAAIGERAVYCGDLSTLAKRLENDAKEGDLVLIMGAGDIEQIFSMLPL